jgi:hypothetical protein
MEKCKAVIGILLLTMLIAAPCGAKTRDWKPARVVNVTESAVSWELTGQKNTMHYTIETEDMVYFGDYSYRPGEHKNGHAPDVGGNVVTKIAIEGRHAYVLDAYGKEVKLHIVKKIKRS